MWYTYYSSNQEKHCYKRKNNYVHDDRSPYVYDQVNMKINLRVICVLYSNFQLFALRCAENRCSHQNNRLHTMKKKIKHKISHIGVQQLYSFCENVYCICMKNVRSQKSNIFAKLCRIYI